MERPKRLPHSVPARIAMLTVCLLAVLTATCQQYRTQALQQAAERLGIAPLIAQTVNGTMEVLLHDGQKVIVMTDAEGSVKHIGLSLFSPEMRCQRPSAVYDCLEYAALDRCYELSDNDLTLQKIIFLKGTWADMPRLTPADACMVSVVEDKGYHVVWLREGNELISLLVPMDYELLSSSTRKELELLFVREVSRLQSTESLPRDLEEELLSVDPQLLNSVVDIEFQLRNHVRQILRLPLRQWIAYCLHQGCEPRYTYDDTRDNSIGLLHMTNKSMGYHHLLCLSSQPDELLSDRMQYSGKAYLYIPNVDDSQLYGKEAKQKSNENIFAQ